MSVEIAPTPGEKSDLYRFVYGDELIEYELKERKSEINRLLIKVHPDCRVVVLAPKNTKAADVLNAVKKRSRWIYSQLAQFKSRLEHIKPRNYIGGESHYYLGKQYLLKVTPSQEDQNVKLLRGKIEITVSGDLTQANQGKVLLNRWYKVRAKDVFARRLGSISGQALWITEHPPVRVMTMQNQWGSCSPQGRLTLNTHLVKAPRECIDYVILHELCHIAEHNHSPRFYRLMNQVMPNWEEVKERLDGMAEILLNGSS